MLSCTVLYGKSTPVQASLVPMEDMFPHELSSSLLRCLMHSMHMTAGKVMHFNVGYQLTDVANRRGREVRP